MKLQDIDFEIEFRQRIMLGVKDARKPNCFKGQPIDITERFERVMLDYLLAIKENYYIDNVEIELFTGFNDKNGKKIYDGDVLYSSEDLLYVVKFKNGAFYLVEPDDIDGDGDKGNVIRNSEEFEVVGNINKNFEFLKSKGVK